MKTNPCRYCALSYNHEGKHTPSWNDKCKDCTNHRKHLNYLHTQRKFTEGEPITSLDELLKQEWVMWYHNSRHIEAIKSMQLRMILRQLEIGAFKEAIRKEAIDERK